MRLQVPTEEEASWLRREISKQRRGYCQECGEPRRVGRPCRFNHPDPKPMDLPWPDIKPLLMVEPVEILEKLATRAIQRDLVDNFDDYFRRPWDHLI